ncbi:hypothetical protein [Ralstonia holmesii]|uniref:hypothetical protein n=1 Tax=Ralstonia holmesii TaxID=3058602 RepID=UPI003F1429F7
MTTAHLRRLTLFANLSAHFQHTERMQIKSRIELDADDIKQAIQNFVREKTGRDIVSVCKVERERGSEGFSVPSAYDLGPEPIDETTKIKGA